MQAQINRSARARVQRFLAGVFLGAVLAFVAMPACAATPPEAWTAPTIAVVGGRIIDGYGQAPIENGTVLIKGERIVAVGSQTEVPVPPDAKIIGLSYLIVHDGPPEGFAGPNDVWHQHASNGGLCLDKAGVVIGGERISEATCKARGGYKAGLENIWMVHDWVAPGWECSWGVFAAECPELGGRPGGTSASPIS